MTDVIHKPSLRLREATRSRHVAIEGLDFYRALREHALPRQPVVSYLRGLCILHALLETTLERTVGPAYGPWRKEQARLDDLLATLEASGSQEDPDIPAVIDAAIHAADRILAEDRQPAALLGNLYVLEGARLGGQLLRRHFAAALGVAPTHLMYCSGDRRSLNAQWTRFRQRLDALAPDAADVRLMIGAAQAMFDDMAELARNAWPFDEHELRHRVTAINPEAGRHAMPQSETEIARALRCAGAAWRRFPYLEMRYGERGRRFTLSDSCWLLSLYDLDEDTVIRNLSWLRGVLSNRGLPTLVLETHLEEIDRDIRQEDPARARQATGFRAVIEGFRTTADRYLPAATRSTLNRDWQIRFTQCPGRKVPRAAELLISARIDTAIGNARAWPEVRDWLLDPQRFSADWIAVVEGLSRELEAFFD